MPKLDLHGHSEGAAETATRWWLEEQAPSMKENKLLIIVTGWGKNRQMWQTSDINDKVRNVLHDMEVQILPQDNPGRLLIAYSVRTGTCTIKPEIPVGDIQTSKKKKARVSCQF